MARVLSSSYARSLLFFVGASIGAGMFGLPALFARSGLAWGSVVYWVIVGLVLLIHMAYAELQAKAGSKHDLAGIAKRSLGRGGWIVALVVYPISVYGSTLVYLLLGSRFLAALSGMVGGPTDLFGWQLVFWLLFAGATYVGVRGIAKLERPLSAVLLAGILLLCVVAAVTGHEALPPVGGIPAISLAGIIGFVFFTTISLPMIAEVMALDGRKTVLGRRTVLVGTLLAALLKWLFALSFSGAARSGDVDVLGLMTALPVALSWLLPLIGFFALSTAVVSVLDSLRTVYRDEFNFRSSAAWILAVLPPLVFVALSHQSLLPLMSFLGSFVASTNALLVCLAALVERTRLIGRLPRVMMYAAIGLCLFTIAHTFIL